MIVSLLNSPLDNKNMPIEENAFNSIQVIPRRGDCLKRFVPF